MARLDHLAWRVKDRWATANFFVEAFGYRVQKMEDGTDEFKIDFGDGQFAQCVALEPPEKVETKLPRPWVFNIPLSGYSSIGESQEYHLPPEIFISDGTPDSIVGKWGRAAQRCGRNPPFGLPKRRRGCYDERVEREGLVAVHHRREPIACPGLEQVFSKPNELLGGVIIEFIKREKYGFCASSVKKLMESSKHD